MIITPIIQYHEPAVDDDDELAHFVCDHRPHVTFCGQDMSDEDSDAWWDGDEIECVVCHDLDTWPLCPWTGRECDCSI